MSDHNDTRIGLLSGLFATIMVIALSMMAMSALSTAPMTAAGQSTLSGTATDAARLIVWLEQ